jgi:hypothetical protein
LRRFELLAQDFLVVAGYLDERLIADAVEISLHHRLEDRGLDRERLRPRRLHRVGRLRGLRLGTAAAIDGLVHLNLQCPRGQVDIAGRREQLRRIDRVDVLEAGVGVEGDRRPPIRERLRHLLVGGTQQRPLREKLRVRLIGVGERLGQRFGRRRMRGDREEGPDRHRRQALRFAPHHRDPAAEPPAPTPGATASTSISKTNTASDIRASMTDEHNISHYRAGTLS